MRSTILKQKITKAINEIEDTELLEAVYTILEKQLEPIPELTQMHKKELDRRRANHLSGKSKSYSWEQVKKAAVKKKA